MVVTLNKQHGQCQARAIHSFKICMFIIFSANHMPSPHNLLFFSLATMESEVKYKHTK